MTTETKTAGRGLATATLMIDGLQANLRAENLRHGEAVAALERGIEQAQEQRDLILWGASLDVVEVAETLIEVRGRENAGVGDGPKVIAKAIRALAHGGRVLYPNGNAEMDLFTRYLGTKNYDRWRGQEEGGDYGTAPRHGTQVFSIGFKPPYRRRWNPSAKPPAYEDGEAPTEEQLDAAIAYLHALHRGST